MSPHPFRHSAITAALDATDGNIRKVQKLSRHADPQTILTPTMAIIAAVWHSDDSSVILQNFWQVTKDVVEMG
jgi:integrase